MNDIIRWKAVDPRRNIFLPEPWPRLKSDGFSPLLLERVRRFALCERETGTLEKYREVLALLGQSYLPNAFSRARFLSLAGRGNLAGGDSTGILSTLQLGMLDVIESLARESEGILPVVLWNTLASLVIRPNATKEESIINVQEYLMYPWYICDAALHAMGVAYGLFFHVQGRLSQRTGHVIFHGCGCNHFLGGAGEVMLRYTMPPEKLPVAGKEFLDHFLGQTTLIMEKGYPFRLNDEEVSSVSIMSLKPATHHKLSFEAAVA